MYMLVQHVHMFMQLLLMNLLYSLNLFTCTCNWVHVLCMYMYVTYYYVSLSG